MNVGSLDRHGEVWRFILHRLKRRTRVALLLVVDSKGSAPGKTGFKMAVASDGKLCGTIGGGAIEHDVVEDARALLRQPRPRASVMLKVHQLQHPQTSGMICGGQQTVALYPCLPKDRSAVKSLLACLEGGKPGVLRLSASGLSFNPGRQSKEEHCFVQHGTRWRYTENVRTPDTLFIVGGGHVGLALSCVMATLGFRIVVFDERPDVDTLVQNIYAHEKRVMPFTKVGRAIPDRDRHYAVIMTPAHSADEAVLRQLVRKRLNYLGLMASAWKARALLGKLRAEGCPTEMLRRVRSPVGLPIASHTPAEIAVSIAAEIIQVRNTGFNPRAVAE